MNFKNEYDNFINTILKINYERVPLSVTKYNEIYNETNNKNILVLGGGGIKGFAHIGALKALEENKLLNDINTFAGTSVGALVIALIVIGYKPQEIFTILVNEDLSKLKSLDLLEIFDTFGMDNGKKIQLFIDRLIEKRDLEPTINLYDLYKLTNIKIIFTTVCVNTKQVEYISYETYPKLALNKAILMSISIPWVYRPVNINNKLFVDGGCIDNYPIHIFADRLNHVIGIYLTQDKYILDDIPNIETYTLQIIQCLMESMDYNAVRGYEKYTTNIKLNNISAIDYGISKEEKIKMFNSGFSAMISTIQNM